MGEVPLYSFGFRIPGLGFMAEALASSTCDFGFWVQGVHPRVDARQSQKSTPRFYRGIDVKRQLPLPLT